MNYLILQTIKYTLYIRQIEKWFINTLIVVILNYVKLVNTHFPSDAACIFTKCYKCKYKRVPEVEYVLNAVS